MARPPDMTSPADPVLTGNWASRNRTYLIAAGLALAALLAFAVDLPLARFAATHSLPRELSKLFALSEVFSHGLGVLLVVITVAVLDRLSWPKLPRLLTSAYGAGILANIAKVMVERTRPHATDLDLQGSALDTFHRWLPALGSLDGSTAWNSSFQSFPSGHTATAVGLAIGLTWMYPHGRWLFLSLACLAACQRMDSGAHYLSDTLAAAALACVWAGLCVDRRAIGRLFDKRESRSKRPADVHSSTNDRSRPLPATEASLS